MPKVKPKQHAPLIDMTAMVDVAFLLLTFFILATSFKAPEATLIKPPSSVNDTTAPGSHAMNISVDSIGRVFIGFSDLNTRENVLKSIEETFKFQASAQGKDFFKAMPEFGLSFAKMGSYLNQTKEEMVSGIKSQDGIPYPYVTKDSTGENELKRWIVLGTTFDPEVSKNVNVKADESTPVEAVQKVFATLQEWNINRFNLITEKEEVPTDMVFKVKKPKAEKGENEKPK